MFRKLSSEFPSVFNEQTLTKYDLVLVKFGTKWNHNATIWIELTVRQLGFCVCSEHFRHVVNSVKWWSAHFGNGWVERVAETSCFHIYFCNVLVMRFIYCFGVDRRAPLWSLQPSKVPCVDWYDGVMAKIKANHFKQVMWRVCLNFVRNANIEMRERVST